MWLASACQRRIESSSSDPFRRAASFGDGDGCAKPVRERSRQSRVAQHVPSSLIACVCGAPVGRVGCGRVGCRHVGQASCDRDDCGSLHGRRDPSRHSLLVPPGFTALLVPWRNVRVVDAHVWTQLWCCTTASRLRERCDYGFTRWRVCRLGRYIGLGYRGPTPEPASLMGAHCYSLYKWKRDVINVACHGVCLSSC